MPDTIWPHPQDSVSITLAAKLLKCARSSLSRQIVHTRDGNPPETKNPAIAIAAKIFCEFGEGANPAVSAGRLIAALNIPTHQISISPAPTPDEKKEVRHRISKKKRTRLRSYSEQQLTNAFEEALKRVEAKNNLNARRWLRDIIDEMAHAQLAFPRSTVDSVPTGRFVPFSSLADWSAHAAIDETYLFFFRRGTGRPIDYRLLSDEDFGNSSYRFLTLSEWMNVMQSAIAHELALNEQKEIEDELEAMVSPLRVPDADLGQ